MLSRAENELLTRTGPGTPMGDLMRRHWFPFMPSAELERDGPPKRITLLGEKLVAYRGSDGQVGLLAELCPHRRASLFFGRNEAGGLRCAYHGWKFDASGRCLDMPSEPPASQFKDKVRARAYPCVESTGFVWTHMGPNAAEARLPELDWIGVSPERRYVSRWLQDCNYAQALEGEIDEAHVSFLHSTLAVTAETKTAVTGAYFQEDRAPAYIVHDTDYGMACGSRRRVDGGRFLWRVNLFMLPFFTLICPSDDPHLYTGRAWIPADDEHCWVVCIAWRTDRAATERETEMWRNGEVQHRRVIPGTVIPFERFDNDYLIDRAAQKSASFSGIQGIRAQDAAMTESPGPIADRSEEHLGSSDRAVIAFRRRMLGAARALAAGTAPATARGGDAYRGRPVQALRDDDTDFFAVPEIQQAMAAE